MLLLKYVSHRKEKCMDYGYTDFQSHPLHEFIISILQYYKSMGFKSAFYKCPLLMAVDVF